SMPSPPGGGESRGRAAPPPRAPADVLRLRVEERRERAVDVAQPHLPAAHIDHDPVGAHRGRGIAEPAEPRAGVVQAEEADHVVLVDAVTRYAKPADELAAAIDRHGTGKDLDAVLEPVLPRRDFG